MHNVLIVDDDPRVIDALERNVDWTSCGVQRVFRAMNVSAALDILARKQIDILVSDIEMPNGSGLQLLEQLREMGRDIKCIFDTCHPEFDYMRSAIQLQCSDYILKPIRYDEFARVLSNLVNKMDAEAQTSGQQAQEILPEVEVPAGKEQNLERLVKGYVNAHMTENINVSEIAEQLHFNPHYLMRVFKKKTGMSVLEYITYVRVEAAKGILENSELSIREVASAVGYADYAYFTRVFGKEVGQSPSNYRSRFRV